MSTLSQLSFPRPLLALLAVSGTAVHLSAAAVDTTRIDPAVRANDSLFRAAKVYFGTQHAYIKKSLGSVEERLPRQMFLRVSRQHIVNLTAIAGIEEAINAGYLITLDDGKKLAISRRNAAQLKETLSL